MKVFDFDYMLSVLRLLTKYVHVTISIATISMLIALILGFALALIRLYKVKGLYAISNLYVSFFRGTPLVVQLFLLYFGIPQVVPFFSGLNNYTAAIIGLSLNASAYMAEIMRGAIVSVEKGQMEAALSVGMSNWQGMKKIVLPQATRLAIPALGNSFIDLIKGSSLAFTLGVADVLAKAQMSAAASYKFFESYLAAALIYWVLIELFNRLQKRIEKAMNKAY